MHRVSKLNKMKTILHKLSEGHYLDTQEASEIMTAIGENKINNEQVNAFVSLFLCRELTVDELKGFKNALLNLSLDPKLFTNKAIDVCGTGGDGKNTFNISTLTAFVVAGAGIPVIKHGNHGVSSFCGSSDIMTYFGMEFTSNSDRLNEQLYKNNICLLHAPLFHPALKNVAKFRKSIGIKTLFNQLGPLINPAQPLNRLNGTYDLSLLKKYAAIYADEKLNFKIVHTLDGYDEISLTQDAVVYSEKGENYIEPEFFKMNYSSAESISGGNSIDESAKIFMNILNNTASHQQRNVVIANSALAIQCFKNNSIDEAIDIAKESIEGGKALNIFKNLLK